MLRSIVVAAGVLCLAGAVLAFIFHALPGALVLAIWGAILIAGTLYERTRYKPTLRTRPGNSVRTGERFVDDSSGKTITVYIDPASGERSYVEE